MKENIDDEEVEISNQRDLSSDFQDPRSMDLFLDEFLKNTIACAHTHTCSLSGSDLVHAHTCYHAHT